MTKEIFGIRRVNDEIPLFDTESSPLVRSLRESSNIHRIQEYEIQEMKNQIQNRENLDV